MKILAFIVNRANYGRLKPVLQNIKDDWKFDLTICCTGTTVEEKYGNTFKFILDDGFDIKYRESIEVGTQSLDGMAFTCSNSITMATNVLLQEKPDLTLIIGDRYETLGIAIASSFLNVPIAHIQGGELSGSIDENIRHSITKLSHYHFTATERSRNILLQLGEDPDCVFNTGCPAGDLIISTIEQSRILNSQIKEKIPSEYILVVYHPTTTEIHEEELRISILINAILKTHLKVVWLKPNSDAGSKLIQKALDNTGSSKINIFTSFTPEEYINVMNNAQLCVGNSSSFLRDSGFLGVPVVLVGNRQENREYSHNLIHSDFNENSIYSNICSQIEHGRYEVSKLYGDGNAAAKITKALKNLKKNMPKKFNIIQEFTLND
tara:strand:+ start:535 stop:1671 length:1137 start_codon:yes stop_codon:yes gene_type:complete